VIALSFPKIQVPKALRWFIRDSSISFVGIRPFPVLVNAPE